MNLIEMSLICHLNMSIVESEFNFVHTWQQVKTD